MIHAGVFVTGVLDLLFWSMIGMLSFLVIFYVNNGDVGFIPFWVCNRMDSVYSDPGSLCNGGQTGFTRHWLP